VLESLAQAGAFDSFGSHRAEVFGAVPALLEAGARARMERERGQTSLFDAAQDAEAWNPCRIRLPAADPWPPSQVLALEKEVLGFYFSGHPLSKWSLEIRSFGTVRTSEAADHSDGAQVVLGCMVTKVRTALDRRGNRIAFLELEDFTGTIEAIVFSDPLQNLGECLAVDSMILAAGALSFKDEADPKLMLGHAVPLDRAGETIADRLILDVADLDVTDAFIERLRDLARESAGSLKTVLRLALRDGNRAFVEVPAIRLRADRATIAELEALVGEGGVRLGGNWPPPPSERRGGRREGPGAMVEPAPTFGTR
jgi:DNA polymerase-3 subunit alpha